jgi:hypothetical protein
MQVKPAILVALTDAGKPGVLSDSGGVLQGGQIS